MNLKFWKKDDFSDFKLPPMNAESNLGLGSHDSGLDLTGGYQASAGAGMPSGMPMGAGAPMGSMAPGAGMGANSFQDRPFATNSFTSPNSYSHDEHEAPAAQGSHGKDLEVIGAKLDAIRSQLDMLNLRISTLEQRLPHQESASPKKPWY